jgi:hypothetical protein
MAKAPKMPKMKMPPMPKGPTAPAMRMGAAPNLGARAMRAPKAPSGRIKP